MYVKSLTEHLAHITMVTFILKVDYSMSLERIRDALLRELNISGLS